VTAIWTLGDATRPFPTVWTPRGLQASRRQAAAHGSRVNNTVREHLSDSSDLSVRRERAQAEFQFGPNSISPRISARILPIAVQQIIVEHLMDRVRVFADSHRIGKSAQEGIKLGACEKPGTSLICNYARLLIQQILERLLRALC